MPVNPNEVKNQDMISILNRIEAKINEVITDTSATTDPLDLSDEE